MLDSTIQDRIVEYVTAVLKTFNAEGSGVVKEGVGSPPGWSWIACASSRRGRWRYDRKI